MASEAILPARGPAIQRVKDEGKREEIDTRMDALHDRTQVILTFLKQQGEDWEALYAAKGKEKSGQKFEDLWTGKKSDYKKELMKEALKRYWASLTTEEKIELVSEAAEQTGKGAALLASAGLQALSEVSLPSSGRSEPKERRDEPKESSDRGGLRPSLGWLTELNEDHFRALYEVYKTRKKVLDRIQEFHDKTKEQVESVGQSVGGEIGKLRMEAEFIQHCEERRKEFMVARTLYLDLEEAIEENEDRDRYKDELDAFSDALININGPAMVYYLGSLTEEGRKGYPELCDIALHNLSGSQGERKSLLEQIVGFVRRGVRWVKRKLSKGRDAEEERLALVQGQEDLAGEVTQVAGKKWNKFTKGIWSAPSGVKQIRKDMAKSGDALTRLAAARKTAEDSAKTKSDNRHPNTQIFYETIRDVKVADLADVRMSISILQGVGAKLG